MKTLILLLGINALALVAGIFLFFVAPLNSDLQLRLLYTQLDRGQVINQQKLRAFDAALAKDDRNQVPRWMAQAALSAEKRNAKALTTLSLLNIAILAIAIFSFRRGQQPPARP